MSGGRTAAERRSTPESRRRLVPAGLLKFGALVAVVGCWTALPDRYDTVVLQAFTLVSPVAVGLNALTLAGA